MLKSFRNIQVIFDQGLCAGCGTCFAVCPKNAVSIFGDSRGLYVPVVNDSMCNECGLCLKVCPGYSVNFTQLNEFVFGRHSEDALLGNYTHCYIGHAVASRIRHVGQSGGLVTALLIFALEKGIVNRAVVSRMSEDDPLTPQIVVPESKEEIISASKSKYCPVPLNIVVKEVLKNDGKYAIVGLPCHMHGLRKFEMVKSDLKKRIVLHFGLFCSNNLSFLATDFLLYKAGIRNEDLNKIEYRSKKWRGWPGDVLFVLKNGAERFIPREYRIRIKPFFTPWRCSMCFDQVNEFTDISFGDAWLPETMKYREGMSIIITRTEMGERLLQEANRAGIVKVQEIPRNKAIQSQEGALFWKKKVLGARLAIARFFHKGIPEYRTNLPKPRKVEYFATVVDYLNSEVPYHLFTRFLLKHIPLRLLQLYNVIAGAAFRHRKNWHRIARDLYKD